jgi:arylformamidase
MRLIDISRALHPNIAVWPGDTPFALQQVLDRSAGATVNLTTLTMSAHTGTHVDAPRHFVTDGTPIAQLDLTPYWGLAQVVTIAKPAGALFPADFAHVDLSLVPRLLVRSAASERDPTVFDAAIVYPSPELADALGQAGIVLYGTDAPSMDAVTSETLPGHAALYRNKIAILEGLDLRAASDGVYELAALPLKIVMGDGSPVRAVLRGLDSIKGGNDAVSR